LLLFSDINISQGSVATHLRGGGIFYYRFTTNLLRNLSIKEFSKSVSISQSYRQKYSGTGVVGYKGVGKYKSSTIGCFVSSFYFF